MDGGHLDDARPHPWPYMCGNAPWMSRNRGLQHRGQHGVEGVGRELLDGPDELQSGVVDEDVGARRGGLRRVQVGEVQDVRLDGAREATGLLDE